MPSKPKALVFAHPFEGRTSYFLAGLSHFYDLDIYFVPSKRFRFAWQVFYKWQYSKTASFIRCESLNQLHQVNQRYDAAFLFLESYHYFLPWPLGHKEILDSINKIRRIAKEIFWLEIGERQYFTFGGPEFWDNISGVLKGQVYKKEYEHILKDPVKVSLFQDSRLAQHQILVQENAKLDINKYRSKIIPFPFTPTITDIARYDWKNYPKTYDWAANTRTSGNGLLRYAVIEQLEKKLPENFSYSIEYHNVRHAVNLVGQKRPFDIYLTKPLGKYLFKLLYSKYFYAQPLYLHNLLRARCYLGLGWSFSSLRTADAWGAGTVLINFSFNKCDYGIPVEDGYNYFSLGERDEMTKDNENFDTQFTGQIVDKMQNILSDKQKQQAIIKNQLATFNEYFISPAQFVKKIFIEKTGVLS